MHHSLFLQNIWTAAGLLPSIKIPGNIFSEICLKGPRRQHRSVIAATVLYK